MIDWQNVVALTAVVVAAAHVIRQAWRTFAARPKAPGCGGCAGCSSKAATGR